MRLAFVAFALITAITTTAVAQAPPVPLPSIALPPELDRVLRDYERGWRAGDEKALAELFTEDGFVPTNGGWVRGRDAIRRNYQNSQGDLRLRAVAYAVADTVGYIVGAYGYGEEGQDRGKFVLALRRPRGGAWLIAADIDQSNRAASN
ncbi:MAG TPA: nuclear transport factor 2 family protein [Gemmatimonadales bacterium]|nr:nuclear transport factor 2 family protein [Gemmatimonadales bacterium]